LESNYSWALPFIDRENVRLVCEIGSRDGLDSVFLADWFAAQVYCFECDPINLEVVKGNLAKSLSNIRLFPFALGDEDKSTIFYSIDPLRYSNRGASSFFRIDFSERNESDPDFGLGDVQNECTVKMKRYDGLKLAIPDLIVMDAEGSEMMVLRGFSQELFNVSYIVTECAVFPRKDAGASFADVRKYLKTFGFRCAAINGSGSLNFILSIFRYQEAFVRRVTGNPYIDAVFVK
jgi:FkbM family methyltransferase